MCNEVHIDVVHINVELFLVGYTGDRNKHQSIIVIMPVRVTGIIVL